MRKQYGWFALQLLMLGIAAHSIVAGMLLLLWPLWILRLVGWDYAGQVFWPSQAGLFLALLGGVYAAALRFRPLIWFIVVSKASAVVFLSLSVVFLGAPKVVIAMALGDGLMGLSIAIVFWMQTRLDNIGLKRIPSKNRG